MSRLHSEALLARVISDAASLSISETTSSDGTTVYGIGATSGRAILAVGAFTLRGIEKGIILCKLLSIRKRLRSKQEVDLDTVTTLLELQRCVFSLELQFFRQLISETESKSILNQ